MPTFASRFLASRTVILIRVPLDLFVVCVSEYATTSQAVRSRFCLHHSNFFRDRTIRRTLEPSHQQVGMGMRQRTWDAELRIPIVGKTVSCSLAQQQPRPACDVNLSHD
jgi:hypothetical protein